tara:strand:- start:384 stop:653 length:270 start_codon:yes stop_codon:yes gene_type:complete
MRIYQLVLTFFVLINTQLFAGDLDTAKKNVVNRFTDSISDAFGNLVEFDGIKQADLEFDVTNQLKSTQQAADACYMWVEPPSVSVALSG